MAVEWGGPIPLENKVRLRARANEKVRPPFLCLPEELSPEQAGGGPGFLTRPASSGSQLLAAELAPQACLLWPDALHGNSSRTMSGECQGRGTGGACAFSAESKVFFTGGVRPRAA